MSYDRQIDQICTHVVVEEALFVGSDRQTVVPQRPIASATGVRVRMNGAIACPSYGVYLPAQVVGVRRGLVTIPDPSASLRLQVDQGAVQTLTVGAGTLQSPDRIAALLSHQVQGAQFFEHLGHVGMRSLQEGRASSLRILSSSPLADLLGLPVGREVRGVDRVPGWTLINDPNTLNDRPTRLIVFDAPLPSEGDYVEVDYATVQQECRRCGATGVEFDWRYGATGEVVQVRDEALLIQEIQKIMYTLRGSNPFHPLYGTTLLEMVGKKQAAGGFLQNLIVTDVYDAFSRWQKIKQRQETEVGQTVSDREFPFRLLGVDLQVSQQDPTVIYVNITVQNRSFEPIQLQRGIRFPQPMNLLGATQQQGIIRQSLLNSTLVG